MTITTIDPDTLPGAQVRTLRYDTFGTWPTRAGVMFIVEEVVTAEESDDGVPFVNGSSDNGVGDMCVKLDNIEVVRTREEVNAREIPSMESIAVGVISALEGMDGDDFQTFETNWVNEERDTIEVAGQAENGLFFAFRVKISDVRQTDI